MFDAMAAALAFFYEIWPSYAGAIILLTVAIMLLLTPLSIKSTRSMLAMSRLQPEMKKLQVKYKDDRQKLNEEMMAFYQANKINPFSSCLPLLLQMPIFLVLYRVINGLGQVETRSDGSVGPKYLATDTEMYQDLAQDIVTVGGKQVINMMSFGIDLAVSPWKVLTTIGFVDAIPYLLMVVAVAVTGFIQQKQVSGRNPSASINPQQQMITRIMPAAFAAISISIAAGVVVYFITSNIIRIGQQALVTRLESGKIATPASPSKPALPAPKSAPTNGPKANGGGKASGGKSAGPDPKPSAGGTAGRSNTGRSNAARSRKKRKR